MSSGKRYKFQGSQIQVLSGYAGGSPLLDITAITKTNPAAVTTASAHGLATGDVVKVTEVVGMTEVNNSSYIVHVTSPTAFELVDTNATAYGTYVSGGKVNPGTFSDFCELTNYDRTGATSPTIPATTICSTAEEYEVGLPGSGTTKVDYNFAPQTTLQLALTAFDLSKDLMAIRILLPNSGGARVQLGFVQQLGEKAAVGGLWAGTLTVLNTGPYYDYTN